jgi:hypothetical protein
VDATVNCHVPLSTEDIKTLETMVEQIGGSTGAKPSVFSGATFSIADHCRDAITSSQSDLGLVADKRQDQGVRNIKDAW